MAKLTVQEYFDQLRAVGMQLAGEDMPLEIAARDTVAMMHTRIFIDGKDRHGNMIGDYNTTNPLYVNVEKNKNVLPRNTKAIGKNGDTGNVGQNKRKTAYFENYLALRQDQGVQTKYVDLLLSGRLSFNFVNSSVSTSSSTLKRPISGKGVRLEKIDKLSYVIRLNAENWAKAKGNQVHFRKPIFLTSKEEKENFKRVLQFETIKLANNA